jgi:hypothetical protein
MKNKKTDAGYEMTDDEYETTLKEQPGASEKRRQALKKRPKIGEKEQTTLGKRTGVYKKRRLTLEKRARADGKEETPAFPFAPPHST